MSTFGPSADPGTTSSRPGWQPPVPPSWAKSSGSPPPWAPPGTPAAPDEPPRSPKVRRLLLAVAISVVLAGLAVAAGVGLRASGSVPAVSDRHETTAPATTAPATTTPATTTPATTAPTPTTGAGPAPTTVPATAPQTSSGASATVVSAVDPAIVDINTTLTDGVAAGTGMVLTSDGYVLTNNHVIAGATSIQVQIQGSGPTYGADVVGYDVTADVAVIKLKDATDLTTIPVGDASTLRVGDAVVAIGNALGEEGPHAVTTGSVEALDQTITAEGETPGDSETLHGLIQHSAGLQPGDSGGALVDSSGKVIGMNSAALASQRRRSSTAVSTEGYAIPIDQAMTLAQQMIAGTPSATVHIGDRAILGVEIDQQTNGSGGVVVSAVDSGPAAKAGVQAGDVITEIDGTAISTLDELATTLAAHQPGDKVKLTWTSDGTTHSATITLIAGPPA